MTRNLGLCGAVAIIALVPTLADAQNRSPTSRTGLSQGSTGPAVANTATPAVQVPPPAGLLVLIRATLIGLNQANTTGNYSVLWALGSDTLRARYTQQTLAQSFVGLRSARVDLSPAALLTPQLTRQPVIEQGRFLHLIGFFPTRPAQINFDLQFEPTQNQWRVSNIILSLSQAPQQPQPPQPQPPQRR